MGTDVIHILCFSLQTKQSDPKETNPKEGEPG